MRPTLRELRDADLEQIHESLDAERSRVGAAGGDGSCTAGATCSGSTSRRSDLRQHSERHEEALDEAARSLRRLEPGRYSKMRRARAALAWLTAPSFESARPLSSPHIPLGDRDSPRRWLGFRRSLRRALDAIGEHAIGSYIISMTREASDRARRARARQGSRRLSGPTRRTLAIRVSVAPLFETVDDLRHALRRSWTALFQNPRSMRRRCWRVGGGSRT